MLHQRPTNLLRNQHQSAVLPFTAGHGRLELRAHVSGLGGVTCKSSSLIGGRAVSLDEPQEQESRPKVALTEGEESTMEDSIETLLQDRDLDYLPPCKCNTVLTLGTGALLMASYGLWTMFALPGFGKVPIRLKVPYLPSNAAQTANVMKLLEGRQGRLADLGSGDGRLVFAASAAGLQCTGYEINSLLVAYARCKAWWKGVSPSQAHFVGRDFWKTDLSKFNNVTAFLAPGVMEELEEKLVRELPDDCRVVACRFPFPGWPSTSSEGSGLDQVWAYDMTNVRKSAVATSAGAGSSSDLPR
ncbi:protein FAM173B-like isoform X1 [Arapaima gigas]